MNFFELNSASFGGGKSFSQSLRQEENSSRDQDNFRFGARAKPVRNEQTSDTERGYKPPENNEKGFNDALEKASQSEAVDKASSDTGEEETPSATVQSSEAETTAVEYLLTAEPELVEHDHLQKLAFDFGLYEGEFIPGLEEVQAEVLSGSLIQLTNQLQLDVSRSVQRSNGGLPIWGSGEINALSALLQGDIATQADLDSDAEAEADFMLELLSGEGEVEIDAIDQADLLKAVTGQNVTGAAVSDGMDKLSVFENLSVIDEREFALTLSSEENMRLDGRTNALNAKFEIISQGTSTAAASEAAKQVMAAIRTSASKSDIEVRLDPPELGKVRINFQMERGDIVTAVVSAEKDNTMEMLRRHADDLMKELGRAGFEDVQLDFQSGEDGQFGDGEMFANGEMMYDDMEMSSDQMREVVYLSMRTTNRLDRLV